MTQYYIISDNEDDLQRLFYGFEKAEETFNMTFNTSIYTLTTARHSLICKLKVYGAPIEQVMEFNYLGYKITYSKNRSAEVIAQTNKAGRAIWRNKYLNTKGKVRIY